MVVQATHESDLLPYKAGGMFLKDDIITGELAAGGKGTAEGWRRAES